MSSNPQDKILSEIFSVAGRFIIEGGELPVMRGDAEQVKAIRRAALASRRFYEALCNESSTLDTVNVMMDERRRAAENFKRILGREWRF
jgi:hypothetical protein